MATYSGPNQQGDMTVIGMSNYDYKKQVREILQATESYPGGLEEEIRGIRLVLNRTILNTKFGPELLGSIRIVEAINAAIIIGYQLGKGDESFERIVEETNQLIREI